MKRLAISPRLEGLLDIKSEKKPLNEKRNISPEEFQRQANYIKTSVRNFENSSRVEFPIFFTAEDFLHLFCKVCSENNITCVDLNKLIDFIQNCHNNGKFNNLITFTENYDFWEDFNNDLRKFRYGNIYENTMYIDMDKCKFYPNLIGLIDLKKYKVEMNSFVQLFDSLNNKTSISKARKK